MMLKIIKFIAFISIAWWTSVMYQIFQMAHEYSLRVHAAEITQQEPQDIRWQMKASAYTSSVDETDDTPTITASNTTTREGVIANNCLPFGTVVKIDGTDYTVEDRMNKRYGCDEIDIWMKTKEEALTYGVRDITIQIIKTNGDQH